MSEIKRLVVKACPGSGKTYDLAKELSCLLEKWKYDYRGIAVFSFTNVAWKEIGDYLNKKFEVTMPIPFPHFLGTIDKFINQYIFLPFGHLVMGCNNRPQLVGEPFGGWFAEGLAKQFDNFFFDFNNQLCVKEPRIAPRNWQSNKKLKDSIKNMKIDLIKGGYATQLDANFIAMRVLEKYPLIAKAITYRFPYMMIDEAQDTAEVQMRIIDLLIDSGLEALTLIGDPDQAIFEWNEAKPILFMRKFKEWKNKKIKDKNWRSSQKICDFFTEISSFNSIIAVNEKYKDFDLNPQIWYYDETNYDKTIKRFLDLCKKVGIETNPQNIAILARSKNLLCEIQGVKKKNKRLDPWNDLTSKNIMRSKYLYDNSKFKKAINLLEKTVCEIKSKKRFCNREEIESIIEEYDFIQWRKEIYELIKLLPETGLQLGEWKEKANVVLRENQNIVSGFQLKTKRDMGANKYSEMYLRELFAKEESRTNEDKYTIGTIHSVKGETFVAVLLFVGKRGGNSQKYENILKSSIEENEELRTVYVAITRPRKVLVLAVPKQDISVWRRKFFKEN